MAGSIRAREPLPATKSESPLPVSEPCMNDPRLISSAPHIPPATCRGCPADVDCDGEVGDGEPVTEALAGGVPSPGAPPRLWCEVATVAMPALAPAMANTLSAASTGVQPLFRQIDPRGERGSRRGSLATRNATSSTVTRRGGSGVTRCSISASCLSSVFTRPHLRS